MCFMMFVFVSTSLHSELTPTPVLSSPVTIERSKVVITENPLGGWHVMTPGARVEVRCSQWGESERREECGWRPGSQARGDDGNCQKYLAGKSAKWSAAMQLSGSSSLDWDIDARIFWVILKPQRFSGGGVEDQETILRNSLFVKTLSWLCV